MTFADDLRMQRAWRLLGSPDPKDATSIADALWLARVLPEAAGANTREEEAAQAASEPERERSKPQIEPNAGAQEEESATPGAADRTGLRAPQAPKDGEDMLPARAVPVPAGRGLPNRLMLERALRPFLRKYPSRRLQTLDEEATVEASAELSRLAVRFRPAAERWFDVALVVEQDDASEVWADTLREFQALLGRYGGFRRVRVLRYRVEGGRLRLSTANGVPAAQRILSDAEGRGLFLFLTNGTAAAWNGRPLVDFARGLGRTGVVAIVRTVPKRMWPHTALGDTQEWMRAAEPGASNAHLSAQDPFTEQWERVGDASCVPMLTLEAAQVQAWARFVVSPRRVLHEAVRLRVVPRAETAAVVEGSAEERLLDFRAKASPQAFQLLRLLAGAPLTLPIMRLVQEALPGSREQVHLAEVMLSGLIERVTPVSPPVAADQVFYEFVPGVREFLAGTHSGLERMAIEKSLAAEQERLRRYVEEKTGRAVRDFRALVFDEEGTERLPASARVFLEVSRRVYERWGVGVPRATAAVKKYAAAEEVEAPESLMRQGQICWEQGDLRAAKDYIERAERLYSGMVSPDRTARQNLASCFSELSGLRKELGLADGAVIDASRAVQIYRDLLGDEDEDIRPKLAAALLDLADRQSGTGLTEIARERIEEAVEIYQRLAESDSKGYATLLDAAREKLGALLPAVRNDEAEQLVAELELPATTNLRRRDIGRRLAELGDPRRGVGVVDGVPDLLWRSIPGGMVEIEGHGRFEVRPFEMAAYPITFGQFRAFVDAKEGYGDRRWWKDLSEEKRHGAWEKGLLNHPVTHVSWFDATAFCRWVSERLGFEVRLPDEQEWQQAAQSGQGYVYPWGNEWRDGCANTWESKIQSTTAVGVFPQGDSLQGVSDLAGNVWEWCRNEYHEPRETGSGGEESRVLRGGSWGSTRAGYRYNFRPGLRDHYGGFRVVVLSPARNAVRGSAGH